MWGSRWNENWQGKPKLPQFALVHHIPHDLGSNPGRRVGNAPGPASCRGQARHVTPIVGHCRDIKQCRGDITLADWARNTFVLRCTSRGQTPVLVATSPPARQGSRCAQGRTCTRACFQPHCFFRKLLYGLPTSLLPLSVCFDCLLHTDASRQLGEIFVNWRSIRAEILRAYTSRYSRHRVPKAAAAVAVRRSVE